MNPHHNTRPQADLQLAREITEFLPEVRMLISRLRKDGVVIGQEASDLAAALGLLETAAGRLMLRVPDVEAIAQEDPYVDAEKTWPTG